MVNENVEKWFDFDLQKEVNSFRNVIQNSR